MYFVQVQCTCNFVIGSSRHQHVLYGIDLRSLFQPSVALRSRCVLTYYLLAFVSVPHHQHDLELSGVVGRFVLIACVKSVDGPDHGIPELIWQITKEPRTSFNVGEMEDWLARLVERICAH